MTLSHPAATLSMVKFFESKILPADRYHLCLVAYPLTVSIREPFSSQDSWAKYATNGATVSGFIVSRTSGGKMVAVMRVPAVGAMQLHRMLRFSPSLARVYVNPQRPSLAVE